MNVLIDGFTDTIGIMEDEPCVLLDQRFVIKSVSQAFASIIGFGNEDDLVGRSFFDFLAGRTDDMIAFAALLRENGTRRNKFHAVQFKGMLKDVFFDGNVKITNQNEFFLWLHDVTELVLAAQSVDRDPVTGLYNRVWLERRVEEDFELAKRLGGAVMIVADIDDFKSFNDRFGHLIGDKALRATAEASAKSIRLADVVVRYGGDEFVIWMMGNVPEKLLLEKLELLDMNVELIWQNYKKLDEDLLKLRSEMPGFRQTELTQSALTLSRGYARFEPATFFKPIFRQLFQRADSEMYRNKEEKKKRQKQI